MRITYIAEGSSQLGMGNIMHQATVANALKWRALESKRDIVIIDALHVDPGDVKCFDMNAKWVSFNCLDEGFNSFCQVVVNAEVKGFCNSSIEQYYRGENRQVCFKGPRYWFLRDEFAEWDWITQGEVITWTIGVMIGGTDPDNITTSIMEELKSMNMPDTRIIEGENIADKMCRCDLMITGCGLGFWESLKVGTPVIPFASNDLQREYYEGTFKMGELGHLREMIANREFVMPDPKYQIGKGTQEVIDEILR